MRPERPLAILVCVAALASCGRAPEADEPASASVSVPDAQIRPAAEQEASVRVPQLASPMPMDARLDGFGPLRLGMTTAEAAAAWPRLYADRPQRIGARDCDYAQVPGGEVAYFTLMFDDGKFVGYGGSNDDIAAPGGGKRGMREAALQALYARALHASPDRFASGGKLLSLDASGVAPSRLVFVIRPDGVVNEWRVGLRPQVDYDEGCESGR